MKFLIFIDIFSKYSFKCEIHFTDIILKKKNSENLREDPLSSLSSRSKRRMKKIRKK